MPTYVIEREIPGAGLFSSGDLEDLARKSRSVLDRLGTDIQWIESHVADDKIYCIYRAASEELIRQHAQQGGFPADSIARIRAKIDPSTGESPIEESASHFKG
jgi:hypothetical protein